MVQCFFAFKKASKYHDRNRYDAASALAAAFADDDYDDDDDG